MKTSSIHVLPLDDISTHDISTDCHCGVRIEFADPVTGRLHERHMVIHSSFDEREHVEGDIGNCGGWAIVENGDGEWLPGDM